MAKIPVRTVPTDMKYRNRDWKDNLKTIVREVIPGNMPRHHGTLAGVYLFQYQNEYYVGIATNNDAFDGIGELIDPGCTCYSSYLEENANQGNGLLTVAMAACEFSRQPMLILGSWCGKYPKDVLLAAKGYPNKNRWNAESSPDGVKLIEKFFGKPFLNATNKENTARKFTVFNLFKITIATTKKGTPPRPRMQDMNSVVFSALQSVPSNIAWYMEDCLIDVDAGENVSKLRRIGSRRVVSAKEYAKRYEEMCEIVDCKPFKVEVSDDQHILFEDCHVEVRCYPGLQSKQSWMTNLQSFGRDDGDGGVGYSKKGGSSGMGEAPTEKIFLVLPSVYDQILQQDKSAAHSFVRYKDNALGTYGQPETFFKDLMGLQFRSTVGTRPLDERWATDPDFSECVQKPFMIARVLIDGSMTLVDKTGKKQPLDAFALLASLDRQADFWAANTAKTIDIIKAAAKAAKSNTSTALKNWCVDNFPVSECSRVPIFLNELSPKRQKVYDTKSNVEIYHFSGKELTEGKIAFHCNNVSYFALRFEDGTWLRHADTSVDPRACRGVKMYPVDFAEQIETVPKVEKRYQELQELYPDEYIPVFQVRIDKMHRLNDKNRELIAPEEYKHNGNHSPSRAVVLRHGDQRLNIGFVAEVPKRSGNGGQPSEREHLGGDTKFREKKPQPSFDYSFESDNELVVFKYNPIHQRLMINFNSDFGQRYFNRTCVVGSHYAKLAEELYTMLSTQASILFDMTTKSHAEVKGMDVQQYSTGEGDVEPWLYFINYYLTQSLGERWMKDILSKMDKDIDKMDVEDEEEAA